MQVRTVTQAGRGDCAGPATLPQAGARRWGAASPGVWLGEGGPGLLQSDPGSWKMAVRAAPGLEAQQLPKPRPRSATDSLPSSEPSLDLWPQAREETRAWTRPSLETSCGIPGASREGPRTIPSSVTSPRGDLPQPTQRSTRARRKLWDGGFAADAGFWARLCRLPAG